MLQSSLYQCLIKINITIITISFQKNVHINNINIIYYDRIDNFEGTDDNKTSKSKVLCLPLLVFFR